MLLPNLLVNGAIAVLEMEANFCCVNSVSIGKVLRLVLSVVALLY